MSLCNSLLVMWLWFGVVILRFSNEVVLGLIFLGVWVMLSFILSIINGCVILVRMLVNLLFWVSMLLGYLRFVLVGGIVIRGVIELSIVRFVVSDS